jgi:excisionase family DNA binding protein
MSFIDVQRRLLTLDEVASTLGLSRRTVERRVKAGEIPALELGGPSNYVLELGASSAVPGGDGKQPFLEGRRRDPAAVGKSPPDSDDA